jgi:hypothetical protein
MSYVLLPTPMYKKSKREVSVTKFLVFIMQILIQLHFKMRLMKIKVGLNISASMLRQWMMFPEWPGTQEGEEASHQGHHLQGL